MGHDPPTAARGRCRGLALAALALFALGGTCSAAPGLPSGGVLGGAGDPGAAVQPATEHAEAAKGLQQRLDQARAELGALPKPGAEATASAPGTMAEDIRVRRASLILLVGLYQAQLGRESDLADLKIQRADLAQDRGAWPAVPPGPPYPFLAVDRLRESARALSSSLRSQDQALGILDREGDRVRAVLDQSQKDVRRLSAALEMTAASTAESAARQHELDLARLQARVAGAALATLAEERLYTQERRAFDGERLARVQERIGLTKGQVRFSQGELDQVEAGIAAKRAIVDADLERAVAASTEARRALDEAKAALQARPGGAADTDIAAEDSLAQALELARIRNVNAGWALRFLTLQRVGLVREASIWDQRRALADSADPALVRETHAAVATQRRNLDQLRPFVESRLDQARDRLSEQDDLAQRPRGAAEAGYRKQLLDAYRERVALHSDLLQAIGSFGHLIERWTADIEEHRRERSMAARLEDGAATAWGLALRAWNFELFAVDDTIEVDGQAISGQRSVTVGQVLRVIAILTLGYWFSQWFARWFEALAIRRLHIDAGRARIARRWLESLGIVVLVVFALTWVQIPLSVFAFLGGAVAIGAGFGMQTLLKNLISGLMILFERPFRLNDLVEVGTIRGRVTEIGVRASVVRDVKGVETLIPNSSFLEQDVTNWTYSNPRVRFTVTVGVAYGSPTRRVAEILVGVARGRYEVLSDPAPVAIFEDFGADALIFGLDVWLEARPGVDGRAVASELRYEIEAALAQAGIVIAFPQRDLHLDAARPIPIQLVPAAEAGAPQPGEETSVGPAPGCP